MKKIYTIMIVIMFFTISFTTFSFASVKNIIDKPITGIYTKCYIEAEGDISVRDWFAIIRMPNMWKTFWFRPRGDEQQAFVYFWRLVYQSDSKITIYIEENGNILWNHQGEQEVHLVIFGYNGMYIPSSTEDGPLHVKISGNAIFVKPRLI
jgi:hypothetical protein